MWSGKWRAVRKVLRRTLLLSIILWSSLVTTHSPLLLRAQSSNATLTGFITDQSKAAMTNVNVDVINLDTNAHFRTATNREGSYTAPELPPGTYRMEIEKQGFKSIVKPDIVLHVQDVIAINFTMAVGSTSESVTVEAGISAINTIDGSVGAVMNRQLIDNLPLNGRSFQELITQIPGVTLSNSTYGGQFDINGQRPTANYVSIDGASANIGVLQNNAAGNNFTGSTTGGTNALVSVDAMQEFRVLTSSYAPEYGRASGGQIIIRTRSGTNEFHGSAFEYFRNNVLDANDWFANANGKAQAPLRFNDFGGVVGGPIARNKTFFFFSYEGQRIRQPSFAVTAVPSVAARQSATPATQPLLDAYPLPNGPTLSNGQAQLAAGYSNPLATDVTSIRIDHLFTSRFTAFLRYNDAPSSSDLRGAFSYLPLSVLYDQPRHTRTLTSGATYLISPNVVNDLTLNFSDNSLDTHYTLDTFMGAQPLPESVFPPNASSSNALFEVQGGFTGSFLFWGSATPTTQRQANLVDALSFTFGSHQIKFGGDYRLLLPFSTPANLIDYSFASVLALDSDAPTSFSHSQHAPLSVRMTNLSLYAQDAWHISPHLTVTYGLRWELNPPPHNVAPNNGNYIPVLGTYSDASTVRLGPIGSSVWSTKYLNVAPRFGISYQFHSTAGWETVLRAGAGLFYDLGVGASALSPWLSFPNYVTTGNLSGVTFPASSSQAALPQINLSNPSNGQQFYTYPRDFALPRTWDWNVSVQQALGQTQTLTVSYVAALGTKLLYNQYFPSLGPAGLAVNYIDNESTSNYQSLQILFQRRLSHGLTANASYTWAHTLDDVSNDTQVVPSTSLLGPKTNWGPADFDIRHAFNAAFSYDIPSAAQTPWLSRITKGWGADAIVTAHSAFPVNVQVYESLFGGFYFRPDVVPGNPVYLFGSQYPGGRAINAAAFTPVTVQQGDLGRNALRGFDLTQVDLSVRRSFQVFERVRLLFRADLFNLFNHPNFANPINTIGTGTFGVATSMLDSVIGGSSSGSGGLNSLFQVGGPRSVQLSLKLQF